MVCARKSPDHFVVPRYASGGQSAGDQMAGKIFLSYRREDTAGFALALFGRLEQSFPSERLFMDVEGGIGAGQDFVRVIEEEVSLCDVMLVLIGPDWLSVTDDLGGPRLENPQDFFRIEVESALRFGKHFIRCLCTRPRCRAPTRCLSRSIRWRDGMPWD